MPAEAPAAEEAPLSAEAVEPMSAHALPTQTVLLPASESPMSQWTFRKMLALADSSRSLAGCEHGPRLSRTSALAPSRHFRAETQSALLEKTSLGICASL